SPGAQRIAVQQFKAAKPEPAPPLRLVLLRRDVPHDVLGQAAARAGACDVRVGPAELVPVKTFEFWAGGSGHADRPPTSVAVLSVVAVCAGAVRVAPSRSDGAVTWVVQTPSPRAIVARRCTGVP